MMSDRSSVLSSRFSRGLSAVLMVFVLTTGFAVIGIANPMTANAAVCPDGTNGDVGSDIRLGQQDYFVVTKFCTNQQQAQISYTIAGEQNPAYPDTSPHRYKSRPLSGMLICKNKATGNPQYYAQAFRSGSFGYGGDTPGPEPLNDTIDCPANHVPFGFIGMPTSRVSESSAPYNDNYLPTNSPSAKLLPYPPYTKAAFVTQTYLPPTGKPDVSAGNCILQDVQIAGIARFVGFPEDQLATSIAVSLAESGGRVNAINVNESPVSYDIGLWQINDVAHSSYDRQKLGINPTYNADAAFTVYTQRRNSDPAATPAFGWQAWSAYKNGSYSKFIPRANSALQQLGSEKFGITNCQNQTANPGDKNGDGVIDPDEGDTNPDGSTGNGDDDKDGLDCGFTLNPVKATKCALRWAFVPPDGSTERWKEKTTSITESGAFTAVGGIVTYVNTLSDPASVSAGTVASCDANSCNGSGSSPHYGIGSGALLSANDFMANTGWAKTFYTFLKIAISLAFGWYWYNRITVSLGSKSEV